MPDPGFCSSNGLSVDASIAVLALQSQTFKWVCRRRIIHLACAAVISITGRNPHGTLMSVSVGWLIGTTGDSAVTGFPWKSGIPLFQQVGDLLAL